MMIIKHDLKDILDHHPILCANGLGIGDYFSERKLSDLQKENLLAEYRHKLLNSLDQVNMAIAYLTDNKPKRRRDSYGLKHDIEQHYHSYISNGATIVAMIVLGIEYKSRDGLNAVVK